MDFAGDAVEAVVWGEVAVAKVQGGDDEDDRDRFEEAVAVFGHLALPAGWLCCPRIPTDDKGV